MNNKRLISLTVCWILVVVPGLCVLSFADIESGTNTKAEQHFEKANELRKLADYDGAITEYKKVISLSPKSKIAQDAQYWIGQSYFGAGQFDAALSAFQKLLDEYPASTIIPSTKLMMERVQQAKKNKSLFETVKKGDTEQVKSLISKGADVNARDEKGQTPLHFAARNGYREVAILLIAQGADVNASMRDGPWTPLLDAACNGKTQVIKLLLQHGAKVDAGDALGYTPLVYALWSKDEEGVKALISAGADINKRPSENDCPPLFYAVWEGYKSGVRILIDAGANVNAEDEKGWMSLHYAIKGTSLDVINLFVGTGVKIPDFHNAILEGNLARVKQIVESCMDVDTRDKLGWTPTYWAVSTGHDEVFKYLLSQGADVKETTNKGRTLLHQASKAGFAGMVKLLIAKGGDVNAKDTVEDETPLSLAATYGHKDVAELLLDKGADIEAKHKHEHGAWTPFFFAANFGRKNVAELLLARGADMNVRDIYNYTPLHGASWNGHKDVVEFLIAKGADVKAKDNFGRTPLHVAAWRGRSSVVELLITKGANVNAKQENGETPLHRAAAGSHKRVAAGGHKTVVGLLLTRGADVNAKTKEGKTPLSLAKEKGHEEIVELLRKHGAKE